MKPIPPAIPGSTSDEEDGGNLFPRLERHDVLDLFYARIMADERATKHLIREFCGDRRTAEWVLEQMMDFPEARDAMVEKLIQDDEMREKMARQYELFRRR